MSQPQLHLLDGPEGKQFAFVASGLQERSEKRRSEWSKPGQMFTIVYPSQFWGCFGCALT